MHQMLLNMGNTNQRNLAGIGIRPVWSDYLLGHKRVPFGRGEWGANWEIEEFVASRPVEGRHSIPGEHLWFVALK